MCPCPGLASIVLQMGHGHTASQKPGNAQKKQKEEPPYNLAMATCNPQPGEKKMPPLVVSICGFNNLRILAR